MDRDILHIRKEYPINQHDIFLNHAATSPISNNTIAKMQALASEMRRPLSEHLYVWLGIIEDTRRRLSELLHVHPTEVAFCQNTSNALSIIALAIPFKPGDKILVPRNEFPSNIYVWQNLTTQGVHFDFFDVEPGIPVVETLKKINLDGVKLISISAVSYSTGRYYELKEIADFCHERDIYICYDAIQAIGVVDFNAYAIDADFVVGGAQKWLLGSTGVGFFYIKRALLSKLRVPRVGWTSVKYPENFSLKELDFASDMTRFEPGLPDVLPIAALNQSLRDLSTFGWENIFSRVKNHVNYLTSALNDTGIETFANRDQTAGIVSFSVPKHVDVSLFNKNKIHITQRENYLRVSPHFYNLKADLDKFLSVLEVCHTSKYTVVPEPIEPNSEKRTAILTGATGLLGNALAFELASLGFDLVLVGRDLAKLTALKELILSAHKINIQYELADFNEPLQVASLIKRLLSSGKQYEALINCAGVALADEFIHLDSAKFTEMFTVNCLVPFQFMQSFIRELKSPYALGILNIVSATGRCGYPLLSGYAATNAALWELGEVLARESSHENYVVTTYVAPSMHSPMQKKLGRVALRYFKLSGIFPYDLPNRVAKEALRAFLAKKELFISQDNRLKLIMNALFPAFVSRKIKKIWKV